MAHQNSNADKSRPYVCVMVNKKSLSSIGNNCTLHETKFDNRGKSWVWMVSSYPGKRATKVGISYLILRTYTLIKCIG